MSQSSSTKISFFISWPAKQLACTGDWSSSAPQNSQCPSCKKHAGNKHKVHAPLPRYKFYTRDVEDEVHVCKKHVLCFPIK